MRLKLTRVIQSQKLYTGTETHLKDLNSLFTEVRQTIEYKCRERENKLIETKMKCKITVNFFTPKNDYCLACPSSSLNLTLR